MITLYNQYQQFSNSLLSKILLTFKKFGSLLKFLDKYFLQSEDTAVRYKHKCYLTFVQELMFDYNLLYPQQFIEELKIDSINDLKLITIDASEQFTETLKLTENPQQLKQFSLIHNFINNYSLSIITLGLFQTFCIIKECEDIFVQFFNNQPFNKNILDFISSVDFIFWKECAKEYQSLDMKNREEYIKEENFQFYLTNSLKFLIKIGDLQDYYAYKFAVKSFQSFSKKYINPLMAFVILNTKFENFDGSLKKLVLQEYTQEVVKEAFNQFEIKIKKQTEQIIFTINEILFYNFKDKNFKELNTYNDTEKQIILLFEKEYIFMFKRKLQELLNDIQVTKFPHPQNKNQSTRSIADKRITYYTRKLKIYIILLINLNFLEEEIPMQMIKELQNILYKEQKLDASKKLDQLNNF